MSAILSADDLNDFISPGVACIKPVETLPEPEPSNPYEVTTEDKLQAANPAPASISLTDCLACSGCVTSAEAVLVSLQSHTEVLTTLDAHPCADIGALASGAQTSFTLAESGAKVFVASVSPQVRASLAATYNITERQAGHLIEQFLSGSHGLRSGGQNGSCFAYVVDTNRMRGACLCLSADEVAQSRRDSAPSKPLPILTSACPGWICFAEKTHPHILPHLSRLKSPQALTGTLLKSVLSKALGIQPSQIWHLAIMPCFDKKLEASRGELTDQWWADERTVDPSSPAVRDVDCVITSRELLSLASDRGVNLASLPLTQLPKDYCPPFPHPSISRFLFPKPRRRKAHSFNEEDHDHHDDQKTALEQSLAVGTSGGYLYHILQSQQRLYPGSTIHTQRGRNADVVEYTLVGAQTDQTLLKCARFYGFRNIQNLVRKLKPPRPGRLPGAAAAAAARATSKRKENMMSEYAYVEVMACPGGCTNGGGQVRVDEAVAVQTQKQLQMQVQKSSALDDHTTSSNRGRERGDQNDLDSMQQEERGEVEEEEAAANTKNTTTILPVPLSQRDWLRKVDSAYFSASSSSSPSTTITTSSSSSSTSSSTPKSPSPPLLASANDHQADDDDEHDTKPSSSSSSIHSLLTTWSTYTAIPLDKLVYTSFHGVDSDVGKNKNKNKNGVLGTDLDTETEHVARLAASIGGGW